MQAFQCLLKKSFLQYMGSWHFVAAAAWDEDGIKSFKDTDSSVLNIKKGENSTLIVTERWRRWV